MKINVPKSHQVSLARCVNMKTCPTVCKHVTYIKKCLQLTLSFLQQMRFTCSRGAGCMVGLLWQVEDLLTRVRWGNGILTLSGCNWVVLFTIVIGIKELLKPLDEIKIVLKSAFDQLLHWNNLNQGEKEGRNMNSVEEKLQKCKIADTLNKIKVRLSKLTLSTFIRLKDACSSLKL